MNGNLIEEKYLEGIYVGYRWFDSFAIKPRYPFGYGLSYTSFRWDPVELALEGTVLKARVRVTNTGQLPGKDVALLFAACPEGLRRKEQKRLIAFGKTGLLSPGAETVLTLEAEISQLASYHTGKSSWFLDAGCYALFLGKNAEHLRPLGTLTLEKPRFSSRLHVLCPLKDALPEKQPPREARDS